MLFNWRRFGQGWLTSTKQSIIRARKELITIDNIVEVKNLSFTYEKDTKPIFSDLCFALPKGSCTMLLGESGCGKSTLIHAISGIIPRHINGNMQGDIFLCGESIRELNGAEIAQKIGIMFQNPDYQFCTFTVLDEIVFAMENLRLSHEFMEAKAAELMSLLGIEHLKDRPLNKLSGGEKQKVALASVLSLDPEIIVFDEPTANLDPAGTKEVFGLFGFLKEELQKTIIVVEHKLEHLFDLLDGIMILERERGLTFLGSPENGLTYLYMEHNKPNVHTPKGADFFIEYNINGLTKIPYSPEDVANWIIEHMLKSQSLSQSLSEDEALEHKQSRLCFSVDNVSLVRQSLQVLNDISFQVSEGDFVALMGHNGAGKSTLLKTMLHLEKDYTGAVYLYGRPVRFIKKQELWSIASIAFQDPEWQFVTNTVYEEISYSLKGQKLSNEQKDNAVNEYLNRFGLWDKKDTYPFLLSQGEKRRLSVASILVAGQRVLLLDEPTYGQDRKNEAEIMELMRELNNNGVTIIMTTHDMDLAYKYCNKVIVLADGRSAYEGALELMFENKKLLAEARLEEPYWRRVSLLVRERHPLFPNVKSKEELYEYITL